MPAICHAKAAHDMAVGKTDTNNANGFRAYCEVGFFREVLVKEFGGLLTHASLRHALGLSGITTKLSDQIHGIMRETCEMRVATGRRVLFEKNVRGQLVDHEVSND